MSLGVIKAVLWDNDGILVDTERLFFDITRQAFATAGAHLTPEHWARSYLGRGGRSRDVADELGIPSTRIDFMLEARNAAYRRRLEGEIPVRRGVHEALSQLRGRVRLAMVTGSPRDQVLLMHRHTGLLDAFEFLVTGEDCDQAKPHPEGYLKALERFGFFPEECLAVEDSPRGLASALAAAVPCLLYPHALTDLSACAGARAIVHDAREVATLALGADAAGIRPKAARARGDA